MITVVFWVVFGALAGWISAMIDETLSFRQTLAYVATGIIGALVGGMIMQAIGNTVALQAGISNLIFPIMGSVATLLIAMHVTRQS